MSHARTACPRRGLMGRRERVRKEECIEARKHRDNITRDRVGADLTDSILS